MSSSDSNHSVPEDFKLENLYKYFQECLQEDGSLDMDLYVLGYDEIYKFLNLLGTVFTWVASDVHTKNNCLREHRKSEQRDHYKTIQSMIEYEMREKLIQPHKGKECQAASRNLLRLHRALEYIDAFLGRLPNLENAEKCCPHSQAAYKATLAKHHPWLVQKGALGAMHFLPTKEGLIHKICGDSQEAYDEAVRLLPMAVKAMQDVYDKTQQVYAEHKLLDMP